MSLSHNRWTPAACTPKMAPSHARRTLNLGNRMRAPGWQETHGTSLGIYRYAVGRSGHHHDCNGAGLPPPQFGGRVSSFDGQMAGADNKNTSVLLIGDSLDRNIVTSVCDYHGTSYTDYFATNENPPNCTVQPWPVQLACSRLPLHCKLSLQTLAEPAPLF